MCIRDSHPVIVATGQVNERDGVVSPVELMTRAAEVCLSDVPNLRALIQHVSVVNVLSGAGSAPASALAQRLNIQPERVETTAVGGNAPQWLVSRLADSISAGDLDVALIAGGETQRSKMCIRDRLVVVDERPMQICAHRQSCIDGTHDRLQILS